MSNDQAYNENLKRISELLIEERQGVAQKVDKQDTVDLARKIKELNELIEAVKAAKAPYSGPVPKMGLM